MEVAREMGTRPAVPTALCPWRFAMRPLSRVVSGFFALVVLAGCASSQFTSRQQYEGGRIPRPAHILVYNFAAAPADVPAESALAGRAAAQTMPPAADEMEVGRKLGAQVAQELVAEIQAMGLPAEQAAGSATPQIGDIVIRGYFVSIDEGSSDKRILLGFGSGAADLKTMVEGYLMTAQGLRRLGSGEVDSGGNKTPGVLVPLAVVAATGNPIGLIVGGASKVYGEKSGSETITGMAKRTAKTIGDALRAAFQKQGWI